MVGPIVHVLQVPQVQVVVRPDAVFHPVMAQRQLPMVSALSQTIKLPQLQYIDTCSASADGTGFATTRYSGCVYVALLCDGGSFTPDGACDSLWDSVLF